VNPPSHGGYPPDPPADMADIKTADIRHGGADLP